MKKIVLVLIFAVLATISVDAHRYRPHIVSISMQTFYDDLSPYGDWIYTPEYGYVWRPFFDRPEAFRPYCSNGDWVYTEYGWTWISNYPWGWAPFHYGRWYFDDYLGWMWIPGYEWAPAWVAWSSYNDYWGWAPLGPQISVNINFNWISPDFWWTFVPYHRFYSSGWHNYIYDRPIHVTNVNYITNIYENNNNGYRETWFRGPRVGDVEHHTRIKVRQLNVVESNRPMNARLDNNRLSIYNPRVERKSDTYRPAETRRVDNLRSSERIREQNPRNIDPGQNRTMHERNNVNTENRNSGSVIDRNSENPRNSSINRNPKSSPENSSVNGRSNQSVRNENPRTENIEKEKIRSNNPGRESAPNMSNSHERKMDQDRGSYQNQRSVNKDIKEKENNRAKENVRSNEQRSNPSKRGRR